jgi:16S rRNA processing protein RimM
MPDEPPKRICLGRAAGARGLKGEVRIATFTADPLAIGAYGPLEDEAGSRTFEIESVKPVKDGVAARIKGIGTREAAEALKGVEFFIDRARLPAMDNDSEFYHADLIGLVAINADGAALGQIVAVQNYGAGDLLEVRPATGGPTVLVPFTKDIVPDIDRDAGWLLMLPPEGIFGE